MEALTILLLLIILIGILAIFYISIYNNIQFSKTKIEKVEGNIDDDLRTKYDLIIKADTVIKQTLNEKKDYLKDFINLKDEKISNFDLERKLKEAETIITTLYEDNKDLNENESMTAIQEDFKSANEKLIAGISYYNKHVNEMNAFIRKFPNNIVAKIHHIKPKTFFDGKDMTDTDINDFNRVEENK